MTPEPSRLAQWLGDNMSVEDLGRLLDADLEASSQLMFAMGCAYDDSDAIDAACEAYDASKIIRTEHDFTHLLARWSERRSA